jgi:hypothetical protein
VRAPTWLEVPGPGTIGGGGLRPRRDRPRRWHRRVAAVLLLPLIPIAALAASARYPAAYPVVPLARLDCERPVTITFVDDRSSSTWDTDPLRRREREMAQLARWAADDGCALRMGAMSFDDVVAPTAPADVTARGTVARLERTLPVHGPVSSSTMAPSVRQATRWAEARPGDTDIVVIATDGLLADLGPAISALETYPGPVVVMALGGDLPAAWDRPGLVERTVVLDRQVGLGDVARSTSAAIRDLVAVEDRR